MGGEHLSKTDLDKISTTQARPTHAEIIEGMRKEISRQHEPATVAVETACQATFYLRDDLGVSYQS